MQQEMVTLASIANGAALELFEREWQHVLENIADPNTVPDAERVIHIKIRVKPDEDRHVGKAKLEVTAKLAGVKPIPTTLYFGRNPEGELVAVTSNYLQPSMFDTPSTVLRKVGDE